MNRLLLLACATLAWLAGGATMMAAQPNVLLIITDDQGYGDVGVHGNTMLKTPAIDALARQSLRLTNFHVEPTCAETRAALMSGQFPLRVGVWHTIMGRSILRADAVTMPQLFQAAGYRTGMFGKWHLGDNYPYRPQDRGFMTTLHHGGGGVGQTPDVWGNDYFDDVYWSNDELTPVRGYCTDQFFDAAERFITASSDQPFFCYLATNAPHGPYLVEESYKQPYLDQGVAEPMASFYGMIANIDENLGELLALLEQRDLARETLVVFMTDNGTAAGFRSPPQRAAAGQPSAWTGFNAGMRGTKGQQYDGGHRVPCFIRFPDGRHQDSELSALTAHVDLLPTLAKLCDVDVSPAPHLDGTNLLPWVTDEAAYSDRTLVVQSHRVESPVKWKKSAVMTNRWRLVDGDALYDIQADPGQTRDIASQHPQVVEQLRQAYDAWWQSCEVDAGRYSRIPLGAPQTELVELTAHDWHGPAPPWNQQMIRRAPATNGAWQVRIERPGTYQFWLARQPLAEPRALGCSQARVQVGERTATVDVDPSAVVAPLTLDLPAGDASLRTELIEATGDSTGAFFVTVSYHGQTPPSASLPNWLAAGDRIAWVGGTLIERAQLSGALEAEWLARAPLAGLTFCNLGWSGDDVRGRARSVFGDINEGKARRSRDLDLAAPSLVVSVYGMSEALGGEISDEQFREELNAFGRQQVQAGRRLVLCRIPDIEIDTSTGSGIAWPQVVERYRSRRAKLNVVVDEVAKQLGEQVAVIPLPALQTSWFEAAQYVSPAGYAAWCQEFAGQVLGENRALSEAATEQLAGVSREANQLFFDMHRPQNETYLYLFRKHEQGNNAVEPFQIRPLLAERQQEMWLKSLQP